MDRELRVVLSARVFSDQKCFGPGVSQLLKRVDELHSLRAAALSMSMAYSKAWTVVRNAEDGLGFHLLTSTAGGKRGGGAGDLYVAISVRPHRKFRRDGANLYSEMNISFAQAALGDELTIETLQEPVKQTITEGTQPGQVLRVKGQGVPSLRNPSQRGDLFVTLNVEVPKRLNEKQRMALRLFDDAMGGKTAGANRGEGFKKSVKEFFDKFKD